MKNVKFTIATILGDGIGPDVINSAIQIINKSLTKVSNINLIWNYIEAGASYYQKTGLDVEPDGEKKIWRGRRNIFRCDWIANSKKKGWNGNSTTFKI